MILFLGLPVLLPRGLALHVGAALQPQQILPLDRSLADRGPRDPEPLGGGAHCRPFEKTVHASGKGETVDRDPHVTTDMEQDADHPGEGPRLRAFAGEIHLRVMPETDLLGLNARHIPPLAEIVCGRVHEGREIGRLLHGEIRRIVKFLFVHGVGWGMVEKIPISEVNASTGASS